MAAEKPDPRPAHETPAPAAAQHHPDAVRKFDPSVLDLVEQIVHAFGGQRPPEAQTH